MGNQPLGGGGIKIWWGESTGGIFPGGGEESAKFWLVAETPPIVPIPPVGKTLSYVLNIIFD